MLTLLSIAGYDPSGGAGILADIKAFAAFGCYGTAAITSLTSQNTVAVYGAWHQSAEVLGGQIRPILEDFEVAAIKTGMLPTAETIGVAAETISSSGVRHAVVDPVIRSTSGYDLIDDEAMRHLIDGLLPLADVVTPNMAEAERLAGFEVRDLEGMKKAAVRIREMCEAKDVGRDARRAVLVKGGHLKDEATDILYDGRDFTVFRSRRIESRSTHGTGCTLSSAIAALLAKGHEIPETIRIAKQYVESAIEAAPGLGRGAGPLNHFVRADG